MDEDAAGSSPPSFGAFLRYFLGLGTWGFGCPYPVGHGRTRPRNVAERLTSGQLAQVSAALRRRPHRV